MDFAFLGRVSTRDAQRPDQSRAWQLHISERLVEARGHRIVAEFFDVDQSRSIPWSMRPQASALLAEVARPDRRFDGVVIGEPHRAFYGSQFQMTFPVLVHYGVELWVPEVGGRVDPDSEAHDLIMGIFGGMSKGERSRVRKRTKAAMYQIAQHSELHLGGRPPYGYMLVDAGEHGNRSMAAAGARAHRLALDPSAAPTVERIFVMRAAGESYGSIARTLTSEGIDCPSAHDPERNSHRHGRGWTTGSVRAILLNPTYTGVRVWGKQEKVERLVDVADVALGYQTGMRHKDRSEWVIPPAATHPAIVSSDLFARAHSADQRQGRQVPRLYPLSGHIRCEQCGNLMAATFTATSRHSDRGRAYYRCETGKHTAKAGAQGEHPRNVLVGQARLLDPLHAALAAETANVEMLAARLGRASTPSKEIAMARERITQLNSEITALERAEPTGEDAETVASQLRQDRARRDRYHLYLDELKWAVIDPHDPTVLDALQELQVAVAHLSAATDETRREIYAQMRLELRYDGRTRHVSCSIEPLAGLLGPTGRRRYPGLRHDFRFVAPGQAGGAQGRARSPRSLPGTDESWAASQVR